jgi:hypothetical protein
MGHAARDFDALGVNPAILLGKQRRDNRVDVIGRHVHLDTSQIQFHFHSRPFSYLLRLEETPCTKILPGNGHLLPGAFKAAFPFEVRPLNLRQHFSPGRLQEGGAKQCRSFYTFGSQAPCAATGGFNSFQKTSFHQPGHCAANSSTRLSQPFPLIAPSRPRIGSLYVLCISPEEFFQDLTDTKTPRRSMSPGTSNRRIPMSFQALLQNAFLKFRKFRNARPSGRKTVKRCGIIA